MLRMGTRVAHTPPPASTRAFVELMSTCEASERHSPSTPSARSPAGTTVGPTAQARINREKDDSDGLLQPPSLRMRHLSGRLGVVDTHIVSSVRRSSLLIPPSPHALVIVTTAHI